jgi:putative transposase
MPRKSRLDAAGILHHVIIRGIERRPIFTRIADRRDFFESCGNLFEESRTCCYAWALLSNHAHLLVRTGDVPLSKVMARLLSGYATRFNRRHARSGHLFQNRYKSIVCQEESYFKELVRYIHLNPLRAHLVEDMDGLNGYRWSGHSALLGRIVCPWLDVEYILSFFGNVSAYLAFVKEGVDQGHRPDLIGGGLVRSSGGWTGVKNSQILLKGDERILGDTSFVMSVLADAEHSFDRRYAVKEGIDLDTVEKRVASLFGLTPHDLYERSRSRRIAQARSLLCYWVVQDLGLSQKDLADRFTVTEAAISYAVGRGREIARENGYVLCDS